MIDGPCCQQCACPGYQEALEYADAGAVSLFLVEPEGLSFSAYLPTRQQQAVLTYGNPRVRGAGQIAMARGIMGIERCGD